MPQRMYHFCTLEGCTRPHKSRGLCQTHYMQFKRGAELTPEIRTRSRVKPEHCTAEGCLEPAKSKGLCKMHYQRKLRHGHTKYLTRTKPPKPCSVPGCENIMYSNGMCHAHYIRERVWKPFGLTAHGIAKLTEAHNGVCAICKRPERVTNGKSQKVKALSIDHDHKTNRIRGLLCTPCNRGLGLFQDSKEVLQAAIAYLEAA